MWGGDSRIVADLGDSSQVSSRFYDPDLRIRQAMRRQMDVQAAAMRAGVPVGQVLMRQGRPRASAENVVDPDEFDRRHRQSEMQDEMDKRDVVARERRRSEEMGGLAREDLAVPTNHVESVLELENSAKSKKSGFQKSQLLTIPKPTVQHSSVSRDTIECMMPP